MIQQYAPARIARDNYLFIAFIVVAMNATSL